MDVTWTEMLSVGGTLVMVALIVRTLRALVIDTSITTADQKRARWGNSKK